MILKIFRPKNWKKLFIGVIATGITSIAVVCFTLRMIPALSAQSEITAMAAAGFILPGGAAQALKGDMDTEHMVPNNLEDVSSRGLPNYFLSSRLRFLAFFRHSPCFQFGFFPISQEKMDRKAISHPGNSGDPGEHNLE